MLDSLAGAMSAAAGINEVFDHGSDANAGIVVSGAVALTAFSLIAGYGEQGVRECRTAQAAYDAQHPIGAYGAGGGATAR